MGRLFAVIGLLAMTMTPVAALELPDVRADVECPPVTIADLLPSEAEPPPPGDDMPAEGEEPPTDPPPETPPAEDPPPGGTSPDDPSECDTPFVYEMGSPFAQDVRVFSSFGAPRPEDRLHEGIDIPMPKMTPVFAVADGVVSWVSDTCCDVAVRHRDGWSSYYIHLNNDSFGTDDGLGTGVAPGIAEGVSVRQGRLLGWVGDSGNAEETESHLHFELRMPNGQSIDAAPSLREARARAMPALPVQPDPDEDGTQPPLERYAAVFTGPFVDDDGLAGESVLAMLASWGLVAPCDDSGIRVCPHDIPSGSEWASMLAHAGYETPDRPGVYETSTFKDPISGSNGIAVRGCGVRRYCDDQPVSLIEAEGLLTRSTAPAWLPPRIETLACDVVVPTDVTRAGLLLRLALSLGAVVEPPCDLID